MGKIDEKKRWACWPLQIQLMLQQRCCKANRHAEVRSAKSLHNREGHADHASLLVQEGPAGASGSGLRVIYDLVRQHVAHVPLSHQRPDQFALGQLFQHELGIAAGGFHDLLNRIVPCACENRVDAGGIAEADQRFATYGSFLPRIQF